MEEVYKNIYMEVFPLTGNPLKSMNIFLIKGGDENLIVDTGFNNPENRGNMEAFLKEAGVDLKETSLFLTHMHSDHVGLAKYLWDKGLKKIYISTVDGEIVRSGVTLEGFQWQNILKNAGLQGLAKENLDINKHPGFKNRPRETFPFENLDPGDRLQIGDFDFELIDEAGHTPGMVGLYDKDKGILFCGDHLLSKITPNITRWGERYGDSLGDYLNNIQKLKELRIDHLYSSHRALIPDPYARIEELTAHHKKRLAETLSIVERMGEADTTEITKRMSRDIRAKSRDDFPQSQKRFAVGEASAHLKHLLSEGKVEERLGEDGIYYYSLA